MSDDNLRALLLMSVERDITFKLDPKDILDRFADSSDERSKLLKF